MRPLPDSSKAVSLLGYSPCLQLRLEAVREQTLASSQEPQQDSFLFVRWAQELGGYLMAAYRRRQKPLASTSQGQEKLGAGPDGVWMA
jgi:hypothetical protein